MNTGGSKVTATILRELCYASPDKAFVQDPGPVGLPETLAVAHMGR